MVAAHLRDKRGIYHMILSYTNEEGKRVSRSKTTGLPVKGNIKHPPAKPVDFHMRAKPSVLRGHVKRVIRSASCVETVTCCP